MSLPKRLYEVYKKVNSCDLVVNKNVTDETIAEFVALINEAQPLVDNTEEQHQRTFTRQLYYCNCNNFANYVSSSRNKVGALVLWTESKRIIQYFGLQKLIHLSWNNEAQLYTAVRYVRRADDEQQKPRYKPRRTYDGRRQQSQDVRNDVQ